MPPIRSQAPEILIAKLPHFNQPFRESSRQLVLTSPSATMSGTGPRENIFATRMALTNTKLRLKGAQTGHSLLAKKRDALTTRFRAILRKVDEVRWTFLHVVHNLLINLALGKKKDGKSYAACFVLDG